ncbi:alpha/beta hydrolase [Pseudodonghicola flavimaris]|uniref:Alpha/beta hydrolase n=1 Tax=Pseudodonghicola flavimaris TaxID=3050036 RepID=A0ABT7F848_9RHOB|nr:alpha/beta hydrolase [Pseudodonghicola flavimaris]MDK3020777.1 alpha/beta hydrolase [Pseudodonghicola flavimaris]
MLPRVGDSPKDRFRSLYLTGETTIIACKADPRFSYTLYIPESAWDAPERELDLLVAVHGTMRLQSLYRDAFAGFGRFNNCVILAPLFPVGVRGDMESGGYKYMVEGDIRYDEVLLAMVKEAGDLISRSFGKFMLFGFSGGGHFTHRFLYLHPDRLKAVSIGAPGSVTLLDETMDWWPGIRNFEQVFGRGIDFAALKQIKVHMSVGALDTESWEITFPEDSPKYIPGANSAGKNRNDRLHSLRQTMEARGVEVWHDIAPGVPHDMRGVFPYVERFFTDVLTDRLPAPGVR